VSVIIWMASYVSSRDIHFLAGLQGPKKLKRPSKGQICSKIC